MTDLDHEHQNWARLRDDARERGLLDLAEVYARAALKISMQKVERAVARLRRE